MAGAGERRCAWCGADISHRRPNAITCSDECRERKKRFNRCGQSLRFNGPPSPRACAFCGAKFSAFYKNQKYCEPNGACARKAYRRSPSRRAYLSRPLTKASNRASVRKYESSPKGRQTRTERYRRHAAQAALATILLPTHKPPEVNK